MRIQKKLTLSLIGIIMSLMMFAASANAFVCSEGIILDIGLQPSWSTTASRTIHLKCNGATTAIRYFMSPDIEDAGLATALTALALGKNVKAWIVTGGWNALITDIVITP